MRGQHTRVNTLHHVDLHRSWGGVAGLAGVVALVPGVYGVHRQDAERAMQTIDTTENTYFIDYISIVTLQCAFCHSTPKINSPVWIIYQLAFRE